MVSDPTAEERAEAIVEQCIGPEMHRHLFPNKLETAQAITAALHAHTERLEGDRASLQRERDEALALTRRLVEALRRIEHVTTDSSQWDIWSVITSARDYAREALKP